MQPHMHRVHPHPDQISALADHAARFTQGCSAMLAARLTQSVHAGWSNLVCGFTGAGFTGTPRSCTKLSQGRV